MRFRGRPGLQFTLSTVGLLAVALGLVIFPLFVIQPFKHQDPRQLLLALRIIEWRPYAEVVIGAAGVGLLVWYWRRQGKFGIRVLSALGTLFVLGSAALSRVNIYEKMF